MQTLIPPGPLGFANRTRELSAVESLVNIRDELLPVACIVNAEPDSGISRFFEEASNNLQKNSISLLIRGSDGVAGNLFSQILLSLYQNYPSMYRRFEDLSNRKYGHHWVLKTLPYVAGLVPVAGGSAMQALQAPMDEYKKEIAQFPSLMSALTAEFIADIAREEKVNLFIDDAQNLDPWSRELLTTTTAKSYSNLTYFIANVNRSNEQRSHHNGLMNEVASIGYQIEQLDFPKPGRKFAHALIKTVNMEPTDANISSILVHSNGGVRRIVANLRSLFLGNESNSEPPSTKLEDEIVGYLLAAKQSLRTSDLSVIISENPEIFIKGVNEISFAISQLERREIVSRIELPGGEELIRLETRSFQAVENFDANIAKKLLTLEQLYRFAKSQLKASEPTRSALEYIPLAYRLAKEIDPASVGSYGRKIVSLSLTTGSCKNAVRFINDLMRHDELNDYYDTTLHAAVLLANRQFQDALDVLDNSSPTSLAKEIHAKVLKSICLNRVRRHTESIELIDELLQLKLRPTIALTIAAVKVSGHIHNDDLRRARSFFEEMRSTHSSFAEFNYFARNASASLSTSEAISVLDKMLDNPGNADDRFETGSIQNNLAVRHLENSNLQMARSFLDQSAGNLSIFGANHLHIVSSNIGLCNLYEGNFSEAKLQFQKAQVYSNSTMPDLYILINRALCELLLGEKQNALDCLESAQELLKHNTAFSRMFQKFYVNALCIHAGLGSSKGTLSQLAKQAAVHPDRATPEITHTAISKVGELKSGEAMSTADVLKYYSPCTLQYWNFNPMELISEDVLSS